MREDEIQITRGTRWSTIASPIVEARCLSTFVAHHEANLKTTRKPIKVNWKFPSISILPRLRSRLKLSSDQTFQTEIISDQTFQTEIHPDQTFQTQVTSVRLSRHKRSLIRLFWPKLFRSDHLQTMVQTKTETITQTLIRLWSDSSALKEVMISPNCARKMYGQT